jgi:hypothetical protein
MGMTIVIIVINVNLFGKGGFFVTRHFWVPRTAYKISPRVRRIRRALDWVLICHFCWARRNPPNVWRTLIMWRIAAHGNTLII